MAWSRRGCPLCRSPWTLAAASATPQRSAPRAEWRSLGSGVLLLINDSHPRAVVVSPLGLRNHRGDFDNTAADYGRLRSIGMNGSVQSVLMDLYFGRGMNPPPAGKAWPGDYGNWTHWTAFVAETVAAAPAGVSFDIWNAPNRPTIRGLQLLLHAPSPVWLVSPLISHLPRSAFWITTVVGIHVNESTTNVITHNNTVT